MKTVIIALDRGGLVLSSREKGEAFESVEATRGAAPGCVCARAWWLPGTGWKQGRGEDVSRAARVKLRQMKKP